VHTDTMQHKCKVDYCNSVLAGVRLCAVRTFWIDCSAVRAEHCRSADLLGKEVPAHQPATPRTPGVVLVFRCLHDTAPSYLADSPCRATDVDGRRHLRSANTESLVSSTRRTV